ncbi:hypothetical protein GCM10027285_20890 [Oleiagrimonas citrea]
MAGSLTVNLSRQEGRGEMLTFRHLKGIDRWLHREVGLSPLMGGTLTVAHHARCMNHACFIYLDMLEMIFPMAFLTIGIIDWVIKMESFA